jgi:hypothetical protein
MHMNGTLLFHAPFSSHQVSYNSLLCYPIPIGPYGLKDPSGSSSKFQNLVPNGIVQNLHIPIFGDLASLK